MISNTTTPAYGRRPIRDMHPHTLHQRRVHAHAKTEFSVCADFHGVYTFPRHVSMPPKPGELCHENQHYYTRVWTALHPRHASSCTPSPSRPASTQGPSSLTCADSREHIVLTTPRCRLSPASSATRTNTATPAYGRRITRDMHPHTPHHRRVPHRTQYTAHRQLRSPYGH